MYTLYDVFPETVIVHDKEYSINTDFRCVLNLIDILEKENGDSNILAAILSMYDEVPEDTEAAIFAIGQFILGDEGGEAEERINAKKTISFSKDAPYILSDYLRFYQIDLTQVEYLHWRKFRLLLDGLPEDSEMKKRIYYRGLDAGKIKDKAERDRVLRIQKNISLENTEADAERIGELFGGLM